MLRFGTMRYNPNVYNGRKRVYILDTELTIMAQTTPTERTAEGMLQLQFAPPPAAIAQPKGLAQAGSLPLEIQNRVAADDGAMMTVRTIGVGDGTLEYVIPTIVNNKALSEDDAIQHWVRQNNGVPGPKGSFGGFDSVDAAKAFSEALHTYHEQLLNSEKK